MLISVFNRRHFKINLFWKLQFVFWGSHYVLWSILDTRVFSSVNIFLYALFQYVAPILLSYGLHAIYKKYRVHKLSFMKVIAIVLFFSVVCGMLWLIEQEILNYCFWGYCFKGIIKRQIYYLSYSFVLFSVGYIGFKLYEDLILQKQYTEQALLLAKSAQLETLKYQLNPHFLFNTLSSLRGLIDPESTKARSMITHISEFLRYSLQEGKNNEVPLFKEIEIIQEYLGIEEIRYNEDLVVKFDIAPETKDILIPVFLIHPLVENAIKHGMQTSQLPLKIWVNTKFQENSLFISVKNSGKWVVNDSKPKQDGTGTGLENVRKRLNHSFPGKNTVEVITENNQVEVVIKIQFGTDHGA